METKESSKENNVKKWIEDSNIVMAKGEPKKLVDDVVKEETPAEEAPLANDEKVNTRRVRKTKTRSEKRRKAEESDSEPEIKTEPVDEPVENIPTELSQDNENNNVITTDALSDFCNIIGNVPKLQSHESVDSTTSSTGDTKSTEAPTPTKDHPDRRKGKGERHKRRRTQSTNEDDVLKSPKEKKEKQMSPPLEYNPDFLSDLGQLKIYKHIFYIVTIIVFIWSLV